MTIAMVVSSVHQARQRKDDAKLKSVVKEIGSAPI